ncbi:MAG: type II toxin-antitoxin system RelE/ParE family toxin [bacterium]
MIYSYKCKDTQTLAEGKHVRRFRSIEAQARRKLFQIHLANKAVDLNIPPGNRLEKLHGDRKGQWSIRINDQWRICFDWEDDGALNVEIVDYH